MYLASQKVNNGTSESTERLASVLKNMLEKVVTEKSVARSQYDNFVYYYDF